MHLLNTVDKAADLFSAVSQVEQCTELREKLRQDCPGVWPTVRQLELCYWNHFHGFLYALSVLRGNLNNTNMPKELISDIGSFVIHPAINGLEDLSKTLGGFIGNLHPYFMKPETYLESGDLYLQPSLRRLLLSVKVCFIESREMRSAKLVLDMASAQGQKDEMLEMSKVYEQGIGRQKKIFDLSPEAYDLALKIAGPENAKRQVLLAIKQSYDMSKIINELLFQLSVYDEMPAFYIDNETVNFKTEEMPYGRLVQSHILNIPANVLPCQIIQFYRSERDVPIYVVAHTIKTQFNGKANTVAVDITGIDLEEAGPNLLSRFVQK